LENTIEPQGYLRVSEKQLLCRIKDQIMNELKSFNIPFVANAKTVLLYNPASTPEEVLQSLDVLRADLKLRIVPKEKAKVKRELAVVEPDSCGNCKFYDRSSERELHRTYHNRTKPELVEVRGVCRNSSCRSSNHRVKRSSRKPCFSPSDIRKE